MMTFPIYGKISIVPNHQPDWDVTNQFLWLNIRTIGLRCWDLIFTYISGGLQPHSSDRVEYTINNITLWLFNIAMENGPFIDGLPIKNGDFQ